MVLPSLVLALDFRSAASAFSMGLLTGLMGSTCGVGIVTFARALGKRPLFTSA